jgi:hypothetical protein
MLRKQGMVSRQLLAPILEDEAVTRGLGDPEARILIEWLVAQAEQLSGRETCVQAQGRAVGQLCRKARAISRFVYLWSDPGSRAGACQLAATERFRWPLPTTDMDPCELMLDILAHEA